MTRKRVATVVTVLSAAVVVPSAGAAATLSGAAADSVLLRVGHDDIRGVGLVPATCSGEHATVVGTEGEDDIVGTRHRDVIVTGAGADSIVARGGDDLVCAGSGEDVLLGGRGDDGLYGQFDRVTFDGEDYRHYPDRLVGGLGADLIDGGSDSRGGVVGHDTASYAHMGRGVRVNLSTGRGPNGDRLVGIERVVGTAYDDRLLGNSSTWAGDFMVGLTGDDLLKSPNLGRLDGGEGADLLIGGVSDDDLFGGPGEDVVRGREGPDRVYGGLGPDVVNGGGDSDLVQADSAVEVGDVWHNVVDGGSGADYLFGSGGPDDMFGGDGRDELFDGPFYADGAWQCGPDQFNGGNGRDSVYLDAAHFTVNCAATVDGGGDTDTVWMRELDLFEDRPATVDLQVGQATIEDGTSEVPLLSVESAVGSQADDRLIGSDGPNSLDGRDGIDTIMAGGGSDTIRAVAGHDVVDTGPGDDAVDLQYADSMVDIDGGDGADLVEFVTGTAVVVDLTAGTWQRGDQQAALSGVETVIGTFDDDVLRGGDGDEHLDGSWGDDILEGRSGDDRLVGDKGTDLADGGDGIDWCEAETQTNCELP